MEVLGMLAAAIWWFIKALAMIVLLGVALGGGCSSGADSCQGSCMGNPTGK